MMNLFYENLPTSITVGLREVPIVTDFREIIKLMDAIKDESLTDSEKLSICLEYFMEDIDMDDVIEAIESLLDFINMTATEPDPIYTEDEENDEEDDMETTVQETYSFSFDFPYILGGFRQAYGIDLLNIEYMHWWEFKSLFNGLPEDTEIKKRIMYRGINTSEIKNKDERQRVRRIQMAIALPAKILSDNEIGDAFW